MRSDATIRSRVDMTSLAMRWPLPLRRFARVLVASASTAMFAIVLIAARVVMYHTTWPSRSYMLMVAAKLALAWLMIRLTTSVIRNAFIVKLVSMSAWIVAALSMIGQLETTVDALDSVSIVLGGLAADAAAADQARRAPDRGAVADQHRQQFRRKPDQPLHRPDALDPGAAGQDHPHRPDGVRVAVALSAVGINLSALAVFTGAAGVGIGLGLQKIVANFISGIILLADKSVKPGDLVTIGDSSGRISAMNTRYISVAAGDGREVLIPNEDLVTQKVVNWTYTDKNTLVKTLFSTNYDADPRLVCKLAIDTVAAAPRALKGKPPSCVLAEFAEAGMKFSLTFWIGDPDGLDNVRSDVMLALWDAFKREGIGVPYPVRELRVRGALPTVIEASR